MIGKEILGYHVDEKIGSGGFGTVYKVSKTNAAGTYVRALKHITLPTKKQYISVLNSMGGDYAKADDYFAGALQDIVNEIQILSSLSEAGVTNIVRYYENDIIETPSPKTYDIYILMEYLTPLDSYMENHAMTVRDVIVLGKDILRALIACHDKKIIHRDIKDDNIFVASDGEYKLGDFGVSKSLKDKSRAESVKGTPNFIAPEVYLGKEKYDHTVDLYSLGIVLYKLLNKSRNPFLPNYPAPYTTDDEDAAFDARMTGKIPALPLLAQNELGEAVLKAIRSREHRYDTAADFMAALVAAEERLDREELELVVCEAVNRDAAPAPTVNTASAKCSDETVGVTYFADDEMSEANEHDRHLFDTISAPTGSTSTINREKSTASILEAPVYTPPVKTAPDPFADDEEEKKPFDTKKLIKYCMPALFLLLYIGVYMIFIPLFYNKTVSFIDWLVADVDHIVETLRDANNLLLPGYAVVLLIIVQYALLAAFATSLVLIAKDLHHPKVKCDESVKYTDKVPQTILLSVQMSLSNDGYEEAASELQHIMDLLKYSKGFGRAQDAQTTQVERDICEQIDRLSAYVSDTEPKEPDQLAQQIFALKQKIAVRDTMLKSKRS